MCSSRKIFAKKVSMLYVMVNKWDLSCLSPNMGNEKSKNDFKWHHLYHFKYKSKLFLDYKGVWAHFFLKTHFWLFLCGTAVNCCKKRRFSFYAQFAHTYVQTTYQLHIKTYTCNLLWDYLYMVGTAFAKWITCIKFCPWLKCNINYKYLNQHTMNVHIYECRFLLLVRIVAQELNFNV